ncbi:MAG: hypothetical protein HOY79_42510 [Streptomyces sp.]|nr:hypothetical protein [Streptomyces sp.]
MTSKGVLDWSKGIQGDLTITFTSGEMAENLAESDMPGTMRILYLPGNFYMNVGDGAAAKELSGKHWVGYSLKDMAKYSGNSTASLMKQLEDTTPSKSVDALLAMPVTRNLGPAVINGVQTTHFQALVSLDNLDATAGRQLTAAEKARVRANFSKAGITSETIDLFVTKDDLPIQESLVKETAAGQMKTITTYSDYGVAVHPKAPPAYDTASLDEAMNSGDGSDDSGY